MNKEEPITVGYVSGYKKAVEDYERTLDSCLGKSRNHNVVLNNVIANMYLMRNKAEELEKELEEQKKNYVDAFEEASKEVVLIVLD